MLSMLRYRSTERPDLRISLPSEEEQQELIAEAEAETTSAFVISQEDIDAVLTRGSGIYDGKYPPVKNRLPENRQAAYCLLYFHHL